MLVASVTRLDTKYKQTTLRALGTRLDTIDRSVGSTMGSAVESVIGRSMGSAIGKGDLAFVFELIENVVRSIIIFF